MGENWDLLGSYITQFNWGIVNSQQIHLGVPKERIIVTLEPRGRGDQKHNGWNYKIDCLYSDDFFKTKKVIAHKGNRFMVSPSHIYVAQVVDQESQEVVLLGGNSNYKEYNLQPIETQQKKFGEHSYTFLDASDDTVFLHINHFGEVSRYGHIYISDTSGINFSVSLAYNVRSHDNQCDFEKVNSLEGVYISNVISGKYMNNAEQKIEEEELEEKEEMSQTTSTGNGFKSKDNYRDFIKTMITHNKGGNWERLKSPQRDQNGKLIECGQYCYLNLHGISSNFPQFYSVANAAGLIIANGNIGRYLSNDPSDIGTYLSRDGGQTWSQIRSSSHIYEMGDHGALLLIADNRYSANTIQYSWDEGLSFQDLQISDEKILITNIIIEPTSTSQNFIVYGETTLKTGVKKGVAIGINFTGLHEPQCKNPENPDTPDSDYENWTPSNSKGHECVLGKKVTYTRRKRDAQCYNGLTYERKSVVEFCQCTDEDYECDVDFERVAPGEPCVKVGNRNEKHVLDIRMAPDDCNGFYSITRGYRKIPGNMCIGGVKYDPIIIPCPYTKWYISVKYIFIALMILVIFVLVFMSFSKSFFQNVSDVVKMKMGSGEKEKKQDYVNIVSIRIFNLFMNDRDRVRMIIFYLMMKLEEVR